MSGPWIKICGVTTPEAVSAADSVGVDAIGFIFAASPRRITPERAWRLAAPVRGRIACCAVVRRTTQAEVDEILRVLRPDMLQADVAELESLELPETLGATAGREHARAGAGDSSGCPAARAPTGRG